MLGIRYPWCSSQEFTVPGGQGNLSELILSSKKILIFSESFKQVKIGDFFKIPEPAKKIMESIKSSFLDD